MQPLYANGRFWTSTATGRAECQGMEDQLPPLMGFEWNAATVEGRASNVLLTIIAFDRVRLPHVVGTAFAIRCDGKRAVCVSAAHVFDEVRRLQGFRPRHAGSALPEFLPPPPEVNLDPRVLRVVCMRSGAPAAAIVDGLAFDERRDIAFFSLRLGGGTEEDLDVAPLAEEKGAPAVGDLVCVLSLQDQGVLRAERFNEREEYFEIGRTAVLRCGRVLAHHPHGHRLCKGPCIETTIPVFSGMSGGPALYYGEPGMPMRAFGLVCSDPDLDGPGKMDRSIAGRSIIALLPVLEISDVSTTLGLDISRGNSAGEFNELRVSTPPP